jgi:hypothetical protein
MLIKLILIMTILSIQLQPGTEQPFACVADATNTYAYEWGYFDIPHNIDTGTWQALSQVTGHSIWIGYPEKWDIPPNGQLHGAWMIYGDIDGQSIEIWILGDNVDDVYYLFVYNNVEPYADAEGNHYGQHPCGGWRVGSWQIDNVLRGVTDDNQ